MSNYFSSQKMNTYIAVLSLAAAMFDLNKDTACAVASAICNILLTYLGLCIPFRASAIESFQICDTWQNISEKWVESLLKKVIVI